MDTSPKNDFPWELIAESVTGSLTVEEELQLQQWISSDPENKEKYLQIKELWKTGMEDYEFYQMANEEESWKALHARLGKSRTEQIKEKVIRGQFIQKPKLIRNVLAIAAVFVGFIGIGLWFILPVNNPVIYKTALNEQKRVIFIDGSVITLQPQTKIEVPHNYNKSGRTIIMDSGEAYFEVIHRTEKPFIVELGTTLIKDIGTSFNVKKEEKKIDVSVSSGKVAFVRIATQETRELTAGTGITFDVQHESFGMIKKVESPNALEQLLTFENTPLSEVVVAIQKVYGKQIIINDSIANKKLTAHLDGMPYDDAIKVICKSLGLEYSVNDSVYILKAKASEQP